MRKINLFACGVLIIFFIHPGITVRAEGPKPEKIFNGKNLTGWKVPDNNIWWSAGDGILTCKSGPEQKGSILWTEKEYQDFIFQMDFKFGAGRIDAGVFIRTDKQQIQIGESGSLKRDMTCSPYIPGKGYPVEAEGVKDLLKMSDWNTIKIRAEGSVYTMWLNGEKVLTYDSDTAIERGPVGLQLHGNRNMHIDYRNILLAEL
ncbi:MAG: DUF1080 domain-containing protein [Cytophagales bacterium]|nr:DUF1080 domain-containing protein [Cytophagales bacterium]